MCICTLLPGDTVLCVLSNVSCTTMGRKQWNRYRKDAVVDWENYWRGRRAAHLPCAINGGQREVEGKKATTTGTSHTLVDVQGSRWEEGWHCLRRTGDHVSRDWKKIYLISDNAVLENNHAQQLGDLFSSMPKCLAISTRTKWTLLGEGDMSEKILRWLPLPRIRKIKFSAAE